MSNNILPVLYRLLWSALGLVLISGFSWFLSVLYIIPGMVEIYTLKAEAATLSDVWLVLVPIVGYLLLGSDVCLAVKVFNLSTPWLKMSLLHGFIEGLSWGFIGSLILGFTWGIIAIQIAGFREGLVSGLIGLTMVLGFSFIASLIWSLILSIVGVFRS